tara:strand:- start:1247 stop:1435 length:189 start_codon:yes stop_codon:yes gene_type:complete
MEPINVRNFSAFSPNKDSPKNAAKESKNKPDIPSIKKDEVLWFLYPRVKAKILIGRAIDNIK